MTTLIIKAALAVDGQVAADFVDRTLLGLTIVEDNQVGVVAENVMPSDNKTKRSRRMLFGLTLEELKPILTQTGTTSITVKNGDTSEVYDLVYDEKVREADLKEYEPYFNGQAALSDDGPEIRTNVEVQDGQVL